MAFIGWKHYFIAKFLNTVFFFLFFFITKEIFILENVKQDFGGVNMLLKWFLQTQCNPPKLIIYQNPPTLWKHLCFSRVVSILQEVGQWIFLPHFLIVVPDFQSELFQASAKHPSGLAREQWEDWGDTSLHKVLALQGWGSEFGSSESK